MNEKDDLRGVLERGNYTEMAAGEFNSAVAAQLKSYHPHDEIIFVIQRLTGDLSFLKISTPSGVPTAGVPDGGERVRRVPRPARR